MNEQQIMYYYAIFGIYAQVPFTHPILFSKP